MYTVSVRDHFMIAHSFTGPVFGPAQRLHGATYVVDVEFRRQELDSDGIVVDIGRALDTVHTVLGALNFQNLDEVSEFKGRNTTTEFLARVIFDRVVAAIHRGDLGAEANGIATRSRRAARVARGVGRLRGSGQPRLMSVDLHFLVPGDLDTRTGGYGYDRAIISGLRARGWTVHVLSVPGSYPSPSDADRAMAARVLAAVPDEALVLVDGLAFGALPLEAERQRARLRLVALVHHPLGLETGIDALTSLRLLGSERQALTSAVGVIVTSAPTVSAVETLGVPRIVSRSSSRAPVWVPLPEEEEEARCKCSASPRWCRGKARTSC